jgi:phosphoglycolate phosphatase
VAAFNVMLEKRGLRLITREQYTEMFGFPVRGCYEACGFDFSVENWDSVTHEYITEYEAIAHAAPLREGVRRALDYFHGHAVPMSVLSAAELTMLLRMIDQRGISHYFGSIRALPDRNARSKLALGRELVAAIGNAPDEVILVGDTTHDHEVSAALGWRCVLVRGGHQSDTRLSGCDCPIVESVSRLLDVSF